MGLKSWFIEKQKNNGSLKSRFGQLIVDSIRLEPEKWIKVSSPDLHYTNGIITLCEMGSGLIYLTEPEPLYLNTAYASTVKSMLLDIQFQRYAKNIKNPDAGIFADYLLDHGFSEAADCLRKFQ